MVKIIFLHPDLGIGGAERLVVDAALAFKKKGHEVSFYTNHHDSGHCFAETRDGTFPVTVVGDWLPRSVLGRFQAVCAYTRMVYAAIYLAWYVIPIEEPSLIFCDLISLCIPLLKWAKGNFRVVFYCHHPDKLLTPKGGYLKQLYRMPLNWLEELSTSKADKVLVNSKYTARVYSEAFKQIAEVPDICYPSINTEFFSKNFSTLKKIEEVIDVQPNAILLLSINRYERKKNLALALHSLHSLKEVVSEDEWNRVHLIMAGGYDPINNENLEHYEELYDLACELELIDKVTFLKSPSDTDKMSLLHYCNMLIYTPSNEHFGIVPLEAMYFAKPVVAVNSGGPTETVVQQVTGFLCEAEPVIFANAIKKLVSDADLRERMGEAGRKRFEMKFSFDAFTDQLDGILKRQQQCLSAAKLGKKETKNQ